ncbi:MAG: hypothetical protein ACLUKO_16535 [Enterocloster bolteae]
MEGISIWRPGQHPAWEADSCKPGRHLALEHSLTGMEFAAGILVAQAAHWS